MTPHSPLWWLLAFALAVAIFWLARQLRAWKQTQACRAAPPAPLDANDLIRAFGGEGL